MPRTAGHWLAAARSSNPLAQGSVCDKSPESGLGIPISHLLELLLLLPIALTVYRVWSLDLEYPAFLCLSADHVRAHSAEGYRFLVSRDVGLDTEALPLQVLRKALNFLVVL